MKLIGWIIKVASWGLLLVAVIYMADGISRASAGWIGFAIAWALYFSYLVFEKLDKLQRHVARLEDELNKKGVAARQLPEREIR